MDIPSVEPSEIFAGDSVTWTKDCDFSPSEYTLKYVLRAPNLPTINLTATQSGGSFLISAPPTDTAKWSDGRYSWQAFVEKSGERWTVGTGTMLIRPNLATSAADLRSSAQRALESVQAAIEVAAKQGEAALTLPGRGVEYKSHSELIKLQEYLMGQVESEERAARLKQGRASGGRVLVRFTALFLLLIVVLGTAATIVELNELITPNYSTSWLVLQDTGLTPTTQTRKVSIQTLQDLLFKNGPPPDVIHTNATITNMTGKSIVLTGYGNNELPQLAVTGELTNRTLTANALVGVDAGGKLIDVVIGDNLSLSGSPRTLSGTGGSGGGYDITGSGSSGSATPITLWTYAAPESATVILDGFVAAYGSASRASYHVFGSFYRAGSASLTKQSASTIASAESAAGLDAAFDASGNNIILKATGLASETIQWEARGFRVNAAGTSSSSLLTGLRAFWKMDETTGTRVSYTGPNLTQTGTVSYGAGVNGNAAGPESTDNYLSTADDASVRAPTSSDWTWACRVKFTSGIAWKYILWKGSADTTASKEFGVYTDGAPNVAFTVSNGSDDGSAICTGVTLTTGTWYSVIAWYTYADNTLHVTVNGATEGTSSIGGADAQALSAALYVGSQNNAYHVNGLIDDVGTWSRALTPTERGNYDSGWTP